MKIMTRISALSCTWLQQWSGACHLPWCVLCFVVVSQWQVKRTGSWSKDWKKDTLQSSYSITWMQYSFLLNLIIAEEMFECYRFCVCSRMYVCVYVLKCLQLCTVLYGGPAVLFTSTVLYCMMVQQSCSPALCCTVQWSTSFVVYSTSSVVFCTVVQQSCSPVLCTVWWSTAL